LHPAAASVSPYHPPRHATRAREMSSSGRGFAFASCSAAGSAVCEMSRKRLVGAGCDPTTVVALVCLVEGVLGVLAFVVGTGAMPVPGGEFWLPALAAAAASALTTSMLAKAYSENDISSCAPFNAALPVFQLLVTSFVLRDEARLPAHRIAGVCVITGCAFWLAKVSLTLTSAFSHRP
jgi:drug/metabolite transporter (DMT)-like permease